LQRFELTFFIQSTGNQRRLRWLPVAETRSRQVCRRLVRVESSTWKVMHRHSTLGAPSAEDALIIRSIDFTTDFFTRVVGLPNRPPTIVKVRYASGQGRSTSSCSPVVARQHPFGYQLVRSRLKKAHLAVCQGQTKTVRSLGVVSWRRKGRGERMGEIEIALASGIVL